MGRKANQLRRLRRDLENLLALRHSLEQRRLEMDDLAYRTGDIALAQIVEAQAETLHEMKVFLSQLWKRLDTEIGKAKEVG